MNLFILQTVISYLLVSTSYGNFLLFCKHSIILTFYCTAAETDCGDWEPYKDGKCIKLITSLQSFFDAEKTCSSNEESKLISIHNQDEQKVLENYLFKKRTLVDNIWLNAKSADAAKKSPFKWADGSSLTFSNWAPENPKTNSSVDNCLQLHAEDELRGKWSNEPCSRKNAVVCMRKQRWSLDKVQEVLEKLVEGQKHPVPLGFIYVQLPKEKGPQEIWSSAELKWTDISSTYESTFFRVAGSKAAAFGTVQEELSPFIDKVSYENCEYTNFYGETQCDESKMFPSEKNTTLDRKSPSSWSGRVITAHRYYSNLFNGQLPSDNRTSEWTGAIKFHSVGGEVRPRNMAVKVWKRTG